MNFGLNRPGIDTGALKSKPRSTVGLTTSKYEHTASPGLFVTFFASSATKSVPVTKALAFLAPVGGPYSLSATHRSEHTDE